MAKNVSIVNPLDYNASKNDKNKVSGGIAELRLLLGDALTEDAAKTLSTLLRNVHSAGYSSGTHEAQYEG